MVTCGNKEDVWRNASRQFTMIAGEFIKKYLSNHNMALWNQNMEAMMKKYDNQPDICGLLIWFSGRVQTLHDEWRMAHE